MSNVTQQLRASIAYRRLIHDIETIGNVKFTPEQVVVMVKLIADVVGQERRLRLVENKSR